MRFRRGILTHSRISSEQELQQNQELVGFTSQILRDSFLLNGEFKGKLAMKATCSGVSRIGFAQT